MVAVRMAAQYSAKENGPQPQLCAQACLQFPLHCCVLITFPHRTAPGKATWLVYINACTHTHRGRQSYEWRKRRLRQPSEGQRVTRGELRAVITVAGRRQDARGSLVMGVSHEVLIRSQFKPTWYSDLLLSSALPLSAAPIYRFSCFSCVERTGPKSSWQLNKLRSFQYFGNHIFNDDLWLSVWSKT